MVQNQLMHAFFFLIQTTFMKLLQKCLSGNKKDKYLSHKVFKLLYDWL